MSRDSKLGLKLLINVTPVKYGYKTLILTLERMGSISLENTVRTRPVISDLEQTVTKYCFKQKFV